MAETDRIALIIERLRTVIAGYEQIMTEFPESESMEFYSNQAQAVRDAIELLARMR